MDIYRQRNTSKWLIQTVKIAPNQSVLFSATLAALHPALAAVEFYFRSYLRESADDLAYNRRSLSLKLSKSVSLKIKLSSRQFSCTSRRSTASLRCVCIASCVTVQVNGFVGYVVRVARCLPCHVGGCEPRVDGGMSAWCQMFPSQL